MRNRVGGSYEPWARERRSAAEEQKKSQVSGAHTRLSEYGRHRNVHTPSFILKACRSYSCEAKHTSKQVTFSNVRSKTHIAHIPQFQGGLFQELHLGLLISRCCQQEHVIADENTERFSRGFPANTHPRSKYARTHTRTHTQTDTHTHKDPDPDTHHNFKQQHRHHPNPI